MMDPDCYHQFIEIIGELTLVHGTRADKEIICQAFSDASLRLEYDIVGAKTPGISFSEALAPRSARGGAA